MKRQKTASIPTRINDTPPNLENERTCTLHICFSILFHITNTSSCGNRPYLILENKSVSLLVVANYLTRLIYIAKKNCINNSNNTIRSTLSSNLAKQCIAKCLFRRHFMYLARELDACQACT